MIQNEDAKSFVKNYLNQKYFCSQKNNDFI